MKILRDFQQLQDVENYQGQFSVSQLEADDVGVPKEDGLTN